MPDLASCVADRAAATDAVFAKYEALRASASARMQAAADDLVTLAGAEAAELTAVTEAHNVLDLGAVAELTALIQNGGNA